jgi:hypothetical protein
MQTEEQHEEREWDVVVSRRRVVEHIDIAVIRVTAPSKYAAAEMARGRADDDGVDWQSDEQNENTESAEIEDVELVPTEEEEAVREAEEKNERVLATVRKLVEMGYFIIFAPRGSSAGIRTSQAALLRSGLDCKHGVARLQAFYKDGDTVRKTTLRQVRFA